VVDGYPVVDELLEEGVDLFGDLLFGNQFFGVVAGTEPLLVVGLDVFDPLEELFEGAH